MDRFADRWIWPFLRDKLNLKNTLDRGSAENFGPDSGLCMSRSSDCGSDH